MSEDGRAPGVQATVIEARGFDAWFGEFHVLRGIRLDVTERAVTALIGPSGCGKSTFLRWCNRLNDRVRGARATGALRIQGIDVLGPDVDVVELRRKVAMVFHRPNPFPKSIHDNVAFGPRLARRLGRGDAEEIVERSLRLAGLWDEVRDRLGRSALTLSGGQRQRLCIARAIASDPDVLLMDEPCSTLDAKSTAVIEDLLTELKSRFTIVLATNNMQQAARASEHCALLVQGELVEFAPTAKLFSNPSRRETEDFITGRSG
ncbi:MAG: phosphate ABC transporter ATP-binding protein [Planctomycetes bacterium]|nr:phosphate ABC transporter ATP-binding protein [Planctomycetota bacterium]